MTPQERMANAFKVLGQTAKPKCKSPTKHLGRTVSSFIEQKKTGHRDMSKYEYQMCGRKVRYTSEAAAKLGSQHCNRKYNVEYTPYLCPYCNGWHLTKQEHHDTILKSFGKQIKKQLKKQSKKQKKKVNKKQNED